MPFERGRGSYKGNNLWKIVRKINTREPAVKGKHR